MWAVGISRSKPYHSCLGRLTGSLVGSDLGAGSPGRQAELRRLLQISCSCSWSRLRLESVQGTKAGAVVGGRIHHGGTQGQATELVLVWGLGHTEMALASCLELLDCVCAHLAKVEWQ